MSFGWTWAGGAVLAILLFLTSTTYSPSQIPASPTVKPEPAARIDPLGRETPRRAVMGLLKYSASHDFANAARYLQPTTDHDTNLVQRAKELQALHSRFRGDIALLSDDPNGNVDAGLALGQVRAGVLVVGATTSDVILVRVDDPASGNIWLVSKETVANIPQLYAQMESEGPTLADRIVPTALTNHQVLGMSLAQWLGWLISIPISWLLAWLLSLLLSAHRRIWYKLRKLPSRTVWDTPLGMPLRCIMTILVHSLFIYLLAPPLLYRLYYFRFMEGPLSSLFRVACERNR